MSEPQASRSSLGSEQQWSGMDLGDVVENPGKLGRIAFFLVAVVVTAAVSLQAVPPLHYGIRYNSLGKYAELETVYTPGRHFIGPWNSFLLFPATVKSVEFTSERRLAPTPGGLRYPALHTRTKEGLALRIQVSLQYRLIKDDVGKLYSEFNTDYEAMFVSVIRDTLIQVAANYEAVDLWERREHVGNQMQRRIDKALRVTYASCWGLQLQVVELPGKFDASIVATQVQNQQVHTMLFAQQAAQVRAMTKVVEAEFDKKVKVIKAHGNASYMLTTKTARAKARGKVLDVEAKVLHGIRFNLGLPPPALVRYQEYSAVQTVTNATVLYGFDEGNTQLLFKKQGRRLDEESEGSAAEGSAAEGRALAEEASADSASGEAHAAPRSRWDDGEL